METLDCGSFHRLPALRLPWYVHGLDSSSAVPLLFNAVQCHGCSKRSIYRRLISVLSVSFCPAAWLPVGRITCQAKGELGHWCSELPTESL